jgi:hypothetical protein
MSPRKKIFITAFFAGIGLRLGIPGLSDLLEGAWGMAEPISRGVTPPEYQYLISFAGIGIFLAALYVNFGIFVKGAGKGKKGLESALYGFLGGIIVASVVIVLFFGYI